MGRAIAKVKRALKESKDDREDITMDWKYSMVYVKGVRVAKWDWERGILKLLGEALEKKSRSEALIAERKKEDELSE